MGESESRIIAMKNLTAREQKTLRIFAGYGKRFRERDLPFAAELMDHFLDGTGTDRVLPSEFLREAPSVKEGERNVKSGLGTGLANKQTEEEGFKKNQLGVRQGLRRIDIGNAEWHGAGAGYTANLDNFIQPHFRIRLDGALSLGGAQVNCRALPGSGLDLRPDGNYTLDAMVECHVWDSYDFDAKGSLDATDQDPIELGVDITRGESNQLEIAKGAKRFIVTSTLWRYRVNGTVKVTCGEKVDVATTWNEIK